MYRDFDQNIKSTQRIIAFLLKISEHKEKLAKEMAGAIGIENVAIYASIQAKIRKIAQDANAASLRAENLEKPQGFLDPDGSLTVTRLTELAQSVNFSFENLRDEIQKCSTMETREIDEVIFSRWVLDYLKSPQLGVTCVAHSPGMLYLTTKRIITAYATRAPYQAHYEVANSFLAEWGMENKAPDLCDNEQIRLLLAGELCSHIKTFKEKLAWPKDDTIYATESMFWLDHAFAHYIEALGELGKNLASTIRERSKDRFVIFEQSKNHTNLWYFWYEEQEDERGKMVNVQSRFAQILTIILWNDIVQKKWERSRHDFPHLTQGSFLAIIPALQRGNHVESIMTDKGTKLMLYTAEGRCIAQTSAIMAAASSVITMIRTGAVLLSDTLGIMLTVREIAGFYDRYYTGDSDWQSWPFDSYEQLCQTFSINYHKHGTAVRQIIQAQANINFTWPDGSVGSMIALAERPGMRKTKRPVITANYPITPRYSYDIEQSMGSTRAARDAMWKILIPNSSEFPEVVGRRNEEAEQKVAFLLIMCKIAENARVGDLVLTEVDWISCINEAGIPSVLAAKMLDGWVKQGHLIKLPSGGWWLGLRQPRIAKIINEGYVIADRGRKGIPPPRKQRGYKRQVLGQSEGTNRR